jgi:hypothetical protein
MSETKQLDPPDVARKELRLFLRTAEQIGMDTDRLCASLRLSRQEWEHWLGILHDEPLPTHPALPLVLRHLGYLTNRLDRTAHGAYA